MPESAHPAPPTSAAEKVAIVSDLIFASRITGVANHLGMLVDVVRTEAALLARLPGAKLAMVDLNIDGVDGVALLQQIKNVAPQCRVVAFLSHVQVDLAKAARAAGADDVLPRSKFVERLPDLLRE
ncbi:MAG: response regulator [Phycisphaerae bacterium]|nr:response regulator [Phycisphaerae bacterium]